MRPDKSKIQIGAAPLKIQMLRSPNTGLVIALDLETTSLSIHDAEITWISWCTGNDYGAVPLRHRNFDINGGVHLRRELPADHETCQCVQVNDLLQQLGPHQREYLCNNYDEGFVKEMIHSIFSNPLNTVIMHNAKFDLSILTASGWISADDVSASIFDTLLASYVLNPVRDREKSDHSLKELYDVYLRRASEPRQPQYQQVTGGLKFEDIKLDDAAFYAAFDALSAFHLYEKFLPELRSDPRLHRYFTEIETPHLFTTVEMMTSGFQLRPSDELSGYGLRTVASLQDELLSIKRRIFQLVGFTFNFDSPNVLRGILFGKLRITSLDKNRKSGTSKIDSTTLGKIIRAEGAKKHADPRTLKILSHLMHAKRLTEILKKHREMYQHLNERTGRCHPNFRQTTASGRFAASKPNSLSLPSMTGIKEYIVSARGNIFVIADFSQIDLRVIANETWEIDPTSEMLSSVNRGDDLHLSTLKVVCPDLKIPANWMKVNEQDKSVIVRDPASGLSSTAPYGTLGKTDDYFERVLSARKEIAKQVNFGISYGLSAASLLDNLNNPREFKRQITDLAKEELSEEKLLEEISVIEPKVYTKAEVDSYLTKFHEAYPGIRKFQKAIENDLQATGHTYNLFGKLCRPQVISHFESGTFDVMLAQGKWYRVRMRVLEMDDKFLYGILIEANELTVVDTKNGVPLDIKDVERIVGYRVYDLNETDLDNVLANYALSGSYSSLLRGLDALHIRANWHGHEMFRRLGAHVPHIKRDGQLEPVSLAERYPFIKLNHRQIKFVWNKERTIDLAYPGYDQLKRNLVSIRIQSASMDFCKIAMFTFRSKAKELWPELRHRPKIVNCIHDEIAVECNESQIAEVRAALKDAMTNKENFRKYVAHDRRLEVEIGAEDKVGRNYKGNK